MPIARRARSLVAGWNISNMVIEIEVRSVYGRETYYPVNENAKAFARISGCKTLLPGVIQEARKLGFKVLVTPNSLETVAVAMFGGSL